MKKLVILFFLFLNCESNIENASIKDCGIKQIGENLYLQKVVIGSDRIYLLVDRDGKLVSNITSTNFTVTTSTGKSTTSHVETNSFLVR
jgi:hypothetical protein